MAIIVDHESEYKGERQVRDAVAAFFSDDVVVYNNREVNGREYDICLLVKDALIYGLEFNRAKFKLSYVKRDGDKEREGYTSIIKCIL